MPTQIKTGRDNKGRFVKGHTPLSTKGRFIKGSVSPFKGKHHTEEYKIKYLYGKAHPMYGKHPSEETRKKLSEAKKGEKAYNWKGGNILTQCKECDNDFFAKRQSKLQIFCSRKCYGEHRSKNLSGKNHPNYIDGRGNFPYPVAFNEKLKKLIRERDGYKCQNCGAPQEEFEKRLPVHHIDHDKENLDPKNLITLCTGCNTRANYNREYWEELFNVYLA